MPRKLDPSFPSKYNPKWLSFYELPEFAQLKGVLSHYRNLVVHENISRKPPAKTVDLTMYISIWLTGGLNLAALNLDTATIEAASIIRDEYQPPVLRKTAESLKPSCVQLMSDLDRSLADGFVLAFAEFNPNDARAIFEWNTELAVIEPKLHRIWVASGGGGLMPEYGAGHSGGSLDISDPTDVVDLDQIAAIVKRRKKSLQDQYVSTQKMPGQIVRGKGGRKSLWSWKLVRPWLESELSMKLPELYPVLRRS